jgi:hypothetical protein
LFENEKMKNEKEKEKEKEKIKTKKTFHNNKKMIFKKYFPKKWGKKVKNFS